MISESRMIELTDKFTIDDVLELPDLMRAVEAEATIANWTLTSEGGLDDEITVLMALRDNEVWPGYRIDQQWFYTTGEPCSETPTHWAEMPRHPMDNQP